LAEIVPEEVAKTERAAAGSSASAAPPTNLVESLQTAFQVSWTKAPDYLRKALGAGLARTVLTIVLLIFNPFDIDQWSSERSHDIWQRLYAPYYPQDGESIFLKSSPVGDGTAKRAGLSHIGVLLIREDRLGGSRRPTLNDVIDVLGDLNLGRSHYAQPLAVFFDQSLDLQLAVDAKALLPDADPSSCSATGTDRDRRAACLVRRVAEATGYLGGDARIGWGGDARCQSTPLSKLACIQRAGGTPIIYADPRTLP
jgi:hypothetical protein